MGRLSGEDYTELEKLQTVVRTDDGGAGQTRLQIVNLMANHALRALGIDPTPRPDAPPDSDAAQAARFHHALQDELAAFESRGRKPTEVEAYDIVTGLKDTAIKSGSLKVNGDRAALTVASDIPSIDDAFHKPGAQLAQAGPEDDKPLPPDGEPSRPEQELRIDAERVRQREEEEKTARSAVRGNMTPVEIDRWISDWLSGYRPEDAAPPQMPAGLAERLTDRQRAEIEDIVSGGVDTRTDPRVLEEIRRGLRSRDLAERLEWANKPLYRYRPLLSPHDYQQLTIEQAQIDPQTGVANGAVGHPFGTLDQNAALAIELSAARGVGWVYRAGRWVLEKIGGSDDAPGGKDVAPSEGLDLTGIGGGAAKAVEAALRPSDQSNVGQRRKVNVVRELPVPEIMGKVGEQPGNTYYEGAKPGPNEEAAGAEFTKLGYDVTHQKTAADRGIKDVQTADLDVASIGTVDVYTPDKATSVLRILNAIEKKNSQASAVFVQGDFTIDTMQSIAARLWGKPNAQNIETLFFHSSGAPVRRFNRP